ncbi:MAG TPA: efflux RND transporter periplasmic adaptor subunit [Acidobacteriaceae bacterium]
MKLLRVCSLLFPASVVLLFSGCTSHKPADAADTPAPQYRVFDTVVAHVEPVHDALTLAARIQANPTTVVHIYPPISGRVLALKVLPGQEIAKGQIVGMLQSTDLQQARSDYEKAKIEAARADLQLNRARDLLQHQVMAQKDFDDLNAVDQADHAELARALQTLHILGYKETDTSDLVAIRSPIQGVVLDVNTASGELQRSLDNATSIATIANISDVWVLADLYPRDVQAVRRGQPVDVRVNGYPDTVFHGVVDNVSDAVDPQTLTLKVRVVLPNPHHRLKPQMYATVAVTNESRKAIVVPATAVIRDGVTTYVFVQTGENKYIRRDVQLGQAHDTTVEITGGLSEGDRVVSTGAELLRGTGSE